MSCPDKNIYQPQSAKDIPQVFSIDEGFCKDREDNLHCNCWWDTEDKPCCACGYNGGKEDNEEALLDSSME